MKNILIFMLLYSIISCNPSRVYEKNINFEKKFWHVDDRLEFDIPIADHTKDYNIYYTIRNTLDFSFSRIFVEYTLKNTENTLLDKKLVSEYLFDPKEGTPYGDSGLGNIFYHQFVLTKHYSFKKPGTYKIILEQFNRKDTLTGVLSAGIRVDYAKP